MKNLIIFIAGVIVITFLGCDDAGPARRTVESLSSPPYGGVVTVIGTIKTGPEVGLEDCPGNLYLEDETGVVKVGQQEGSDFTQYLGKRVEVQGEYLSSTCLEICSCGNFISVQDITTLD